MEVYSSSSTSSYNAVSVLACIENQQAITSQCGGDEADLVLFSTPTTLSSKLQVLQGVGTDLLMRRHLKFGRERDQVALSNPAARPRCIHRKGIALGMY